MFIVDAHLDLAHNALKHGRDLTRPVAEIRAGEAEDRQRGRATVSFPALRQAGVGLVCGTLYATPAAAARMGWEAGGAYRTADEAHQMALAQLDYYRRCADELEFIRLVSDLKGLDEVVASHQAGDDPLLGIMLLMEGADPIRYPEEVELWVENGLRLVGLAWDNTRYSAGAWNGGGQGLTALGYELLGVMSDFGLILDVTHMSEKASLEALDRYQGPVVATHCNARALVPGERQLGDEQIRRMGERDGVIGSVLYNVFLRAGYKRGDSKQLVTLRDVIDHVDYICQLLGDARHVGLGSDLDGGLGADDIPAELDTVADLPLLADRLLEYGYAAADVANIMGGNWLRLLRGALAGE